MSDVDEITESISTDALLLHPAFWTRKKTKEFLCHLSDLLKDKVDHSVRKDFQKLFDQVVPVSNWVDELDSDVQLYYKNVYFQEFDLEWTKGGYRNLRSLLRAVRNATHHLYEMYAVEIPDYLGGAEEIQQNNENHEDQENQNQGKREPRKVFKERLSPYFGHTPDDTIAYWVHKFPQLVPLCYAFAQSNNLLGSGERYFLENDENASLANNDNCSSFVGVFNELYYRTAEITQYDKLLGRYVIRSHRITSTLKIYKIHPWVLNNHHYIAVEYPPGKVLLTKHNKDIAGESEEPTANPNIISDSSSAFEISSNICKRRKLNCSCDCTNLWKSENMELHSPHLTHPDSLLVFLCDTIDTGLREVYWSEQRNSQSVVIFTKNSHLEVAESVKKFQMANISKRKQLQFNVSSIQWNMLSKPLQDVLLQEKVGLQNSTETLKGLVDRAGPTVLNNMDGDLLLQLIHAQEEEPPKLIKELSPLPHLIVEVTRVLTYKNWFGTSNINAFQQSIKSKKRHIELVNEESKSLIQASKMFPNEDTKIEDLQKTEAKDEERVLEDELSSASILKRKCCIISAESGMGKSTLLQRLARKLTVSLTRHSLIGILRFPDIIKALSSSTLTNVVVEQVITKEGVSKAIADEIATSPFCSSLVSPLIIDSGSYSIFLMIDAIDEVAPDKQECCVRVLELLRKELSHITLYVTTRKENLLKVQVALNSLHSYTLEPLDIRSQHLFLTKYWQQQRTTITINYTLAELQAQEKHLKGVARGCIDEDNGGQFGSPLWLCRLAPLCLKSTSLTYLRSMKVRKRFATRTELNSEFIRTMMSPIYSKEYEAATEGKTRKLSVLYTKEKQEMIAVYEDKVVRTQSHFQFLTG